MIKKKHTHGRLSSVGNRRLAPSHRRLLNAAIGGHKPA